MIRLTSLAVMSSAFELPTLQHTSRLAAWSCTITVAVVPEVIPASRISSLQSANACEQASSIEEPLLTADSMRAGSWVQQSAAACVPPWPSIMLATDKLRPFALSTVDMEASSPLSECVAAAIMWPRGSTCPRIAFARRARSVDGRWMAAQWPEFVEASAAAFSTWCDEESRNEESRNLDDLARLLPEPREPSYTM